MTKRNISFLVTVFGFLFLSYLTREFVSNSIETFGDTRALRKYCEGLMASNSDIVEIQLTAGRRGWQLEPEDNNTMLTDAAGQPWLLTNETVGQCLIVISIDTKRVIKILYLPD